MNPDLESLDSGSCALSSWLWWAVECMCLRNQPFFIGRKRRKKSSGQVSCSGLRGGRGWGTRVAAGTGVLAVSVMEKLSLDRGMLGTARWGTQRTLTCQVKANTGWDSSWVFGGMHFFIQQIFTEHLLCSGSCARHWGHSGDRNIQSPRCHRADISVLWGRFGDKRTNKHTVW